MRMFTRRPRLLASRRRICAGSRGHILSSSTLRSRLPSSGSTSPNGTSTKLCSPTTAAGVIWRATSSSRIPCGRSRVVGFRRALRRWMSSDLPPRRIVVSWRDPGDDKPDDDGWETIERDGQTIRVPRYDGGRRDEDIEGELSLPATMLEHAAAVEPQPAPVVPDPAPPGPTPPSVTTRADRRLDLRSPHRLSARLLFALS